MPQLSPHEPERAPSRLAIATGIVLFVPLMILHAITGIGDANLDVFRWFSDAGFREATRARWRARGRWIVIADIASWLFGVAVVVLILGVAFSYVRDWVRA